MRFFVLAIMIVTGLAVPAASRPTQKGEIRYETSVCFGTCPHYVLTIAPDGRGIFNGVRYTAVSGPKKFRVTRAQAQAFARLLAPYRRIPGSNFGKPGCDPVHSDDITVSVGWDGGRQLEHYFGCDGTGTAELEKALREAPRLLPIDGFIGERPASRRPVKK